MTIRTVRPKMLPYDLGVKWANRTQAGKQLATRLASYKGGQAVVVALPRGGAVVGAAVAEELKLAFDVLLVKKITRPSDPEFAMGALCWGQRPYFCVDASVTLTGNEVKDAVRRAQSINETRAAYYFMPPYVALPLQDRPVIVVDDGMATGLTMMAALRALRARQASTIVVAVPVASKQARTFVAPLADAVITLDPAMLGAVSAHYHSFAQIHDEQVAALLRNHGE